MRLKTIARRLGRAFETKDAKAFDEAMEHLEEHQEDRRHDDEDPDTVEVHNHIPGMDGLGEMPGKDPSGFGGAKDNEMPPWFEEHKKSFDAFCKKVTDDIGNLQKWAKEEEEEDSHKDRRHDDLSDRRHDDRRHDDMAGEELEGAESENLEMDRHRDRRDRRHDDRRQDDEPAERQEMAERIREKEGKDEANKEILGELEFEAPPGTGDRAFFRRARDSSFLEDSFQDVTSKAEVLAPGLTLPTFDAKASPIKTGGVIFRLRKTALDLAYNEPKTRGVIDQALGGRALDTRRMSHGQARVLFNAVASNVASSNNRRATDQYEAGGGVRVTNGAKIQTLSDLNKFNREKHARRA